MTAATVKKISLATILLSGLLVGTLDILSAFVDFYISRGKNPTVILNYIASAAVDKTTSAGTSGALLGLLFHYVIAFAFTFFFFWLYSKTDLLSKNWIVTGILYGLFIWIIVNQVVLRFTNLTVPPISKIDPMKALKAALILICMIGLPLSYIANRSTKRTT
jgi:uncharacterized membrane protein YagU involved in acid resistance